MAETSPTSTFFPPALGTLVQGWMLMLARGAAAILFGLWTLAFPGFGIVSLVMLFGMYAIFDGAVSLALAIGDGEKVWDRWWYAAGGLVSIVAGFSAFLWPLIASGALIIFMGVWALIRGVCEVYAGMAVRRQIPNDWSLIAGGMLTAFFGLFLVASPDVAALALMLVIAAWSLTVGVLMVILAFRLKPLASQQ